MGCHAGGNQRGCDRVPMKGEQSLGCIRSHKNTLALGRAGSGLCARVRVTSGKTGAGSSKRSGRSGRKKVAAGKNIHSNALSPMAAAPRQLQV